MIESTRFKPSTKNCFNSLSLYVMLVVCVWGVWLHFYREMKKNQGNKFPLQCIQSPCNFKTKFKCLTSLLIFFHRISQINKKSFFFLSILIFCRIYEQYIWFDWYFFSSFFIVKKYFFVFIREAFCMDFRGYCVCIDWQRHTYVYRGI